MAKRDFLKRIPLPEDQSRREEIASSVIHGASTLFSLFAVGYLFSQLRLCANIYRCLLFVPYCLSLPAVFLTSTLYHATLAPNRKRLFRLLDHTSIYILIACAYMPLTLIVLQGARGWAVFGVVWAFAALGILFKIYRFGKLRKLSVFFYVVIGWMAIFIIKPLLDLGSGGLVILLLLGGGFYTVGMIFFVSKFLPYNHSIWHLFVTIGSMLHYVALYRFILPLALNPA